MPLSRSLKARLPRCVYVYYSFQFRFTKATETHNHLTLMQISAQA